MEDPFVIVKGEVEASIADINRNVDRWKKLVSGTSAVAKEERNKIQGKILGTLDGTLVDISDLQEAVESVENDRYRFNITQDEITNRKNFIQMTRDQCQTIRDQINNPKYNNSSPANIDRYTAAQQSANRSNEVFIEKSMGEQQQIMRNQDEQLNVVGQSIGRLKQIGNLIGDEVEDQNVLLDEFYSDMGQTENRMSNVQKKINTILEKIDGKKQNCIIGVLLVIMIIVVVLFFST